jgi:hypothetical protein
VNIGHGGDPQRGRANVAVSACHFASSLPCEVEKGIPDLNLIARCEQNDACLTSNRLEAKDLMAWSIDQIIQGQLQLVFQLNLQAMLEEREI